MFSPISLASSLALRERRLVTVVSCGAQPEQPVVQNLRLVQLPLMSKQNAEAGKANLGTFVFPSWKIPRLAYKIG